MTWHPEKCIFYYQVSGRTIHPKAFTPVNWSIELHVKQRSYFLRSG